MVSVHIFQKYLVLSVAICAFVAAGDDSGPHWPYNSPPKPETESTDDSDHDEVSLLQQKPVTLFPKQQAPDDSSSGWPLLVPLRRETSAVMKGKTVVAHRTTYSGEISLGQPAQPFRMIFDTGSAHIVLPSIKCESDTCMKKTRYNLSESSTGTAINVGGNPVPAGAAPDQLTIGYGTGNVTGEFASERVCAGGATDDEHCVNVSIIMCTEMSKHPFGTFNLDGIFGLAFESLAQTDQFSFFHKIQTDKPNVHASFGVFLANGEDGLGSEISLGGHNAKRMLTPLQWAPVSNDNERGHWQVTIKEVRIGGKPMDLCKDGTCRAVVDTGTSHLGVPGPQFYDFMKPMGVLVDDPSTDCREAAGPDVEFILEGELSLHIDAANYMRPIALETRKPGSEDPHKWAKKAAGLSDCKDDAEWKDAEGDGCIVYQSHITSGLLTKEQVCNYGTGSASLHCRKICDTCNKQVDVPASKAAEAPVMLKKKTHYCAPRISSITLPEPMSQKTFILGEPLLHRYYTVYDWAEKRVGFGFSSNVANMKALSEGRLPTGQSTITSFMQVTVKIRVRGRKASKRKGSNLLGNINGGFFLGNIVNAGNC